VKDENKFIFDGLLAQREAIEAAFGQPLDWKRLDHKKSSRIEFVKAFEGNDESQWDEIIDWMIDHLRRLYSAIDGPLKAAAASIG
jgi:hypothetical protein